MRMHQRPGACDLQPMSVIIDSTTQPGPVGAPESGRPAGPPPSRFGTWARVAVALALVAGSAGVRIWQQGRYDNVLRSGRASPFPLAEVPLELGPWRGVEDHLDPEIASAAGAVDSIFRTYTNQQTGVKVSLILIYGPAAEVRIHAPENCYPTSGYKTVSGPETRRVDPEGDDPSVPFFAHTFARGGEGGGLSETQRVFCSWFYEGQWSPILASYKRQERIPGMYKLHLARLAAPTEQFDPDVPDPCEDLVALLLPEIQRRLEAVGMARG